jgi:hypothetical protein
MDLQLGRARDRTLVKTPTSTRCTRPEPPDHRISTAPAQRDRMTFITPTSRVRSALCLIAVCTLTTPAVAARAQDLRSPDARDAAHGRYLTATTTGAQDLRSPDARDAAHRRYLTATTTGAQDLRSPDARDAAHGRYLTATTTRAQDGARDVTTDASTASVRPATTSAGFDWPSAAIGAVIFGGFLLAGYAASILLRHVRARLTA